MELFAAIDLRAGSAVRLTQGDFARQQDYGDPLELAASFIAAGSPWLHVVDLDAARTGVPHARAVLGGIVALARRSGSVRVQTGGGIRDEATVESLLDAGLSRVVLGTAALDEPAAAAAWARRWPGQVVVGLDYVVAADGRAEALGHGWQRGSGRPLDELLGGWAGVPFAAVAATAIARDGMLGGPDLDGMAALLALTDLPVVASGGVAALADLTALAALSCGGRGVAGVIVGKALVEGRFSVQEAVAACAASD
jgi:phosphoribosylformimino-5-aminoimidazole carboxamide ribotide isomerase